MLRALAQRARAASLGLKVGTCVAASCDAPGRGTGLRRLFYRLWRPVCRTYNLTLRANQVLSRCSSQNSCKLVAECSLCLARRMRPVRQIKRGSGGIRARDRARGRAPRAALGQSTVGSPAPLSESKHSRSPESRPFARRPLAANCCGVDRTGPDPAARRRVGVREGGCLCLDLGEERGIFSRPEPTAGARRPHAFQRQHRERRHKTLVPVASSPNSELRAGAPSRGASRAIALCTHPPLRRERYRSNPA